MRSFSIAAAVFMILAVPSAAWAQAICNTDQDCSAGEYCMWDPCPAIACAPGQTCPEPVCPNTGMCSSGGTDVWYGDQCAADADCPAGFTCETTSLGCETYGCGCACPPCDPASGSCPECICDCPAPPACDQALISVCTYSPTTCATDADCDEGFECAADEICYGSSCACPGVDCVCATCPEGTTCPPCECPEPPPCDCPTDPVETCEVVGSLCQPVPVSCTADADCPATWECVEFGGIGTDCACAMCDCMDPAMCDPTDTACLEATTNCNCPPCDCPTEPTTSTEAYCLPAGWGALATGSSSQNSRGESPTAEFLNHADDSGNVTTVPEPKNESSGCSFTEVPRKGNSLPVLALFFFGALIALRRRSR